MDYLEFKSKNQDIINQEIDLENLLINIRNGIKEKGYFIARNLLTYNSYDECRSKAIKYFRKKIKLNESYPHSLRGDVSAGMPDTLGYTNNNSWNIYRSCSFTWNKNEQEIVNIVKVSNCMSKIRNLVLNQDLNYGDSIEKDGYITYTSLSLYPNNGGFLIRHEDGLEYDMESTKQGSIIHFKIELTHKGKDYNKGGFYIKDKRKNEMIDISTEATATDVLFFDGTQSHEVSPTYGGELGRIAFFQIPTYATAESRIGIFSGAGWSKPKVAISILGNKSLLILKKITNKVLDKIS